MMRDSFSDLFVIVEGCLCGSGGPSPQRIVRSSVFFQRRIVICTALFCPSQQRATEARVLAALYSSNTGPIALSQIFLQYLPRLLDCFRLGCFSSMSVTSAWEQGPQEIDRCNLQSDIASQGEQRSSLALISFPQCCLD